MEVCRKMLTKSDVPLAVWPYVEEWQMFCSEVGAAMICPTITRYAMEIFEECVGLPLALEVVSGALRNQKNEYVWRDFLTGLRSPATASIGDLEDKVFKILATSYSHLKNIEEKKCLLFCGVYPKDTWINKSELIKYWRGEGIISEQYNLYFAHAKGESILQVLIDASWLERCGAYNECVKMHDLVQGMVLVLTASANGQEQEYAEEMDPYAVDWENATRISFIDRDLRDLPESPNCPELLTLLLQGNTNLEVIPETFFNKMPKLRVLDLSCTGIQSLPTSVSKLDSLQVLVLVDCEELVSVPPGVLCRLSQMEVFELIGCALNDESTEIVAKELSCLNSLSSIEFNFRGVLPLPHFLENSMSWREQRLVEFWFHVGGFDTRDYWASYDKNKYGGCLVYDADGGGEESGSDLSSALVEVLRLSTLFSLRNHEKLNTLSDLGTIINRDGREIDPFFGLKYLSLENLPNLKSILSVEMDEGPSRPPPPNTESFKCLTILRLFRCPRLEQLFSSASMVQRLYNLEELAVEDCGGLREMISDDQNLEDEALPSLRNLVLYDLPKLESLFNGVDLMLWPSLVEVTIIRCPRIRKLPFKMKSNQFLGIIRGEQGWWEALEWDHDTLKSRYQPFFQ